MKRSFLTLALITLPVLGFAGNALEWNHRTGEDPQSTVEAVVSGLEEGTTYSALPPVLVEATGLKVGGKLWVEVYRGSAVEDRAGDRVVDQTSILWVEKVAVLNVPDLREHCAKPSQYTMVVRTEANRRVVTLATTTFESREAGPNEAALVVGP